MRTILNLLLCVSVALMLASPSYAKGKKGKKKPKPAVCASFEL